MTKTLPLLLAGLLALTGCFRDPAQVAKPQLDMLRRSPIVLNVASLQVDDEYQSPMTDPHVDHLFPVSLDEAVHQWIQSRLVAGGTKGTARVIVRDASVVAVPLPKKSGFSANFTTQEDVRYDGRIAVDVEINQGNTRSLQGGSAGIASGEASHSQSALEGIPLAERESLWSKMEDQLMRDFDTQMETAVRNHLSQFVLR